MATFSKPTTIPRWADTSGNITEPSEGKKDAGWLFQEIPPSDFENWKENLNGNWWKWINERWADGAGFESFGEITAVKASFLVVGADTDTFVLDDGVNPAVTFVFDDDGSVTETSTLRAINHTGTENVGPMRDLIVTAINLAPTLAITASPTGGDKVSLVNDAIGAAGNVTITETVANAGFLVSGMTGGLDVDDEIAIQDPSGAIPTMGRMSIRRMHWLSAAGLEFAAEPGIVTAGRSASDGINLKGIGNIKDIEFDDPLNRMSYNITTDVWSIFNNSPSPSLTVSPTLITISKSITAELGLTASTNQDIAVSGTGRFLHGDRTLHISSVAGAWSGVSGRIVNHQAEADASTDQFYLPISLHAGDRIKSIAYKLSNLLSGTKNVAFKSLDFSSGSLATHDSDSFTTSGTVNASLDISPDHIVDTDKVYMFVFDAGNDGDRLAGIIVTYDHPV